MMMAGAARLIDVHNFQTAAISPVQKNAKFGISSSRVPGGRRSVTLLR
jgi:hypothetical protein